ncbi:hypothetical protein [Kitasatospora viridis]|uniref:Uncharacterized protein n=1 Tax=Kitasatospora viridis TaxID=281105 RepID=A0A561UKQ8_9ACTN|nr:hypothetical protein [Kitasatospora viridis]TWF99926.1 hypothetical protein FHX73_113786 [Kitasatospora viridis]
MPAFQPPDAGTGTNHTEETAVQPTIGRVVHYQLTQQDANTINRRRAARATRERITLDELGNRAEAGQTLPAAVVRTSPVGCNLQVLLDGSDTHWATSRREGNTPGTWSWPPRA